MTDSRALQSAAIDLAGFRDAVAARAVGGLEQHATVRDLLELARLLASVVAELRGVDEA